MSSRTTIHTAAICSMRIQIFRIHFEPARIPVIPKTTNRKYPIWITTTRLASIGLVHEGAGKNRKRCFEQPPEDWDPRQSRGEDARVSRGHINSGPQVSKKPNNSYGNQDAPAAASID